MNTTSELIIAAIVGGGALFLYLMLSGAERKRREEALLLKYGDPNIVESLMSGTIWQGQTREMLIDSMGQPEGVETKVLKSKQKEILKYGHLGANRYRTRVTLENGNVVGWENSSAPAARPAVAPSIFDDPKPRRKASPSFFDEPKPRRKKNSAFDDW